MTPDAKDLCVFAVKRGDMKNRLDINYNLPQYTMLEEKLYQTFGENLKRISDIADVICGPFGSAIKNTDYQDSGIPLVRITNINKDGYMNYDDLIYISEKLGDSLSKTQVSNGDIVVSQRGSLGQCAIVDDSFPKMNISANIIAIKNINGVSVSFLHDYFLSTVGQTLLERSVSGQVQSKITTQDIADLLIPVNTDETKLTDLLDSAYKSYKRKLQQADKLQRKNPTYLIERLGLTSDYSETQKLTYATTAGSIEGRIDADYYSPKFSHFRSQIEALPYHTVSVDDISEKIVSGFAAGKQDQADNLPEDQRVPHLRPFSITPEGELSFETKKYVPKSRLKSEDYCKKNEVNHRLLAIEKLIAEGQMRSNYLIPFCIIVFPDNVSMKDEKIIFHNINSKAVPIRSERLLEGIIVDSKDELSFSDKELDDSFGHEYLLARKVLKNKPLAIRKLKAIPWIRSDLITALIDIIESIQKRFGNIQTAEHEEAFGIALSNALNDAKLGENGTLLISSGLLFLLVALYYNIEISSPSADAVQYKDRLLTWSEKYQITDAQIDTEQNAASNAECIEAIFNRYVRSTEQTIFMSRCFSAEYNETENAIRRAINEINNEKKTGIMLIRVDEHHEGTTGQISDRIFRDIESAGLVIADLSSGKLNVPHEIGYAMGLKKDLILVHNGTSEEAEKHIPSNIRMFEQIRFNGDYQTLQNEIKRRLIDYYKL